MDVPLVLRLAALFVVGAFLGSLVNWAIYALAWNPRPFSPWSAPVPGAIPRHWFQRLPILGWFALRRDAAIHGPRFWIRPLLLEVGLSVALAALYWWEIERQGLVRDQLPAGLIVPLGPLYWQWLSHALLLCLMLAASVIDIDEKIIPDEITVNGTLVGLVLATFAPLSLLPHVAERAAAPLVGEAIAIPDGGPAIGPQAGGLWIEPVTVVAPHAWPPPWGTSGDWRSLAVAIGCYWLWCLALAPRIWRGRRGSLVALRLIAARVRRELTRPPLRTLLVWGTAAVLLVWAVGGQGWIGVEAAWAGMFTALVGLAASGGIVWAVRLIGTAALKREAMGFGDVTLMMMIGTFLGWQACLILFFLAPIAGLVIGLLQFALRRDDVIPYGPFLCLAAAVVVVAWAPIWNWAQPLFELGFLVPAVLVVCLVLLGVMLTVWQFIKGLLFGGGDPPASAAAGGS